MRPDNRVHSKLSDHGVTIIEALMVMAVVGFIMALLAVLASTGVTAWQKQSIRIQMESQSQAFMYLLTQKLRQAQPGTVSISNYPGEMNESMITFQMVNQSSPVSIYLKTRKSAGGGVDRQVWMSEPLYNNAATPTPTYSTQGGQLLASNVVSLYFTYPKISDPSRIIVSIALQKYALKDKLPVYYQSVQTVYVRN